MTVTHGIGQSAATPTKQVGLQLILEQHLATVRAIFAKHRGARWLTPVYQYIDANAGCGYNEDVGCIGSPLVFQSAVDRVAVSHYATLIEIDAGNTLLLRETLGNYNHHQIITGNNAEIVPDIVHRLPRNSYGVLYTDPNGIPDFEMLAGAARDPKLRRVDILIRCAASAVKRNLWQGEARLLEHLSAINKQFWIVREPERSDKWQWTFLLGMNWDGLRVMARHGFHYAHSDRGREILHRLNYTNDELAAMRQPSLFQADPPYATYDEYLQHPQYRAIRALAIRRSGGTCERCHLRPVTETHHVKYPPWGEFDVPENLIAVCHQCHCEIHGKDN